MHSCQLLAGVRRAAAHGGAPAAQAEQSELQAAIASEEAEVAALQAQARCCCSRAPSRAQLPGSARV